MEKTGFVDQKAAERFAQVRASLRHAKVELRQRLAVWGIQLKGFEFRGQRRALATGPIVRTHLPFIPRRN